MTNQLNSYQLSRTFFDWCFENPEKIHPTHIAMYFFIIEHCNRLGWKDKFGLPTIMVKEAIGIRNFRTYTKTLNDLVEWGFIIMVEKSKNQYSSNIVAIVQNAKAPTKALDKAMQKQLQKQSNSTVTIDKQETKQITYNKVVDEILISLKDLFDDNYLVNDKTKVMFDKLLKKYSKDEILKATFWARNDDFWKSNFCSPLKLEKKNKEDVTYIDVFLEKAGNYQPPTQKKQEPQQPIYSGYIDLSKLKPLR
jgi:hypothetical protein